jgi:competence protein ComEC
MVTETYPDQRMRRLVSYRPRRTTLWLLLAVSILGGVAVARLGHACSLKLVIGLAALTVCMLRKRTVATLLLVVISGLSLGLWRGSSYVQQSNGYYSLYGQTVMLQVTAIDDGVYSQTKQSQMNFDGGDVTTTDGQRLPGKIEVTGFGLNAVFEGDVVQASGKLYSGLGSYSGFLSFGKLQLVAHHPTLIADLRRKFTSGMQTALPEPLAPFAMGLLIGQRATLPASVKQDLLMVGLTHIIAVSGYNLTIMLDASRKLLAKRSKRLSTLLSLSLIALFLLFAGASASIVRAAIVSVLSIWAAYYGREFKPLNLITIAAAITVLANPLYLWADSSWYLSFLAFFGVLMVSPEVEKRFVPERLRHNLLIGVALESVCAELMSTPYILYVFNQMSFIGLPANVLVVTLVPLAMLLSLIAGLAGMLTMQVCGWLAWPARLLLNYMLDISHVLAGLPHVFVSQIGIKLPALLGYYALLTGFILILHFKNKSKTAIITERER